MFLTWARIRPFSRRKPQTSRSFQRASPTTHEGQNQAGQRSRDSETQETGPQDLDPPSDRMPQITRKEMSVKRTYKNGTHIRRHKPISPMFKEPINVVGVGA